MMKNLLIISSNKLRKFYKKYLEIKEELKELNFNQEGVFDSVVAPIFFVVTNFGSWLTHEMYEKNFSGLAQSYFMGIPFFHNTLISTLIYLIVLLYLK